MFLTTLLSRLRRLMQLPEDVAQLRQAIGRIELRQTAALGSASLNDREFGVFSQWGEDGILQYLIHRVPIVNRVFVEFGTSNYVESNTRFLLQNDNWAGLVIDSSPENIAFIRSQSYYWRHTLTAECASVDRDNINVILRGAGFEGKIGLLSIDIDGNDYWVWQAIDCITPVIVVCEYNSLLGPDRQLSVPYDPQFSRRRAHYSCLYFGASLAALCALARRRGYALVGSNSAGNNAFFVRHDLMGDIPEQSPAQAWVKAQFRESRDAAGNLSFLDFDAARRLIADLPLIDCESGRTVTLRETGALG